MGVLDGQRVRASVTNPAFINKNQADSMPFLLQFGTQVAVNETTIATAGTINALPSTYSVNRMTGASVVINGAVAGVNGQLLTISNFTGSDLIVNSENAGATAANRFSLASSISIPNKDSGLFYYSTAISRWVQLGAAGGGAGGQYVQEVPSGTINGVNTTFTLTQIPSDPKSLILWLDSTPLTISDYSLVGLTITITNPALVPAYGQTLYAIYGGTVLPPVNVGNSPQVEQFTLSSGDIAAKQITLSLTPYSPAFTRVDLLGFGPTQYGVDFTVSGTTLSWSGLGFDGVLIAGYKLVVTYFY